MSEKDEDIELKVVVPENDAPNEEKEEVKDSPSLSDIIRVQATEEDAPVTRSNLSLKNIILGDLLVSDFVRKQIWLILLITLFLIGYIALGYSYKKYVLEIDKLTVQLKDAKYKALSANSELTEKTRESKILDMLKINNDTLLHISDRPPFIIEVPE
jgi:hypothetical protein